MPPLLWAVTALVLLLAGCARDFPNQALATSTNRDKLPLRQFDTLDPNLPYIVLAFSGGGVRATALGYDVLKLLKQATYPQGGRTRRLIDDVYVVSSVSGGSVTAGWFGLTGPERLEELETKFLTQDNMGPMIGQAFNPVTWFRLAGPSYSRVDVLREYLQATLFGDATFATLYQRPNAPFTVLNATDMSSGEVFDFTPERFDDICSDLAELPLATAVTASAAFPVALTPVDLRNWSGSGCPVNRRPLTIAAPLEPGSSERFVNPRQYLDAVRSARLRDGEEPFKHLLDGGLADNIGGTSVIESLFGLRSSIPALKNVNTGQIKRPVVIVVNARSDPDSSLDNSDATPGVVSVIGSVIGNPIDAATRGSVGRLSEVINEFKRAVLDARNQDAGAAPFWPDDLYAIQIDFDQFDRADPAQLKLQRIVKNIPTSWTISAGALSDLKEAAAMLLLQHPCFQQLRRDLGIRFDDPRLDNRQVADLSAICGSHLYPKGTATGARR